MNRNTRFVGWGCGFFDFDNDGWKDLLLVNGHVFPEVDRLNIDVKYKDRAICIATQAAAPSTIFPKLRTGHSGIVIPPAARRLAILITMDWWKFS